jgi:2-haloacid dehalogenase
VERWATFDCYGTLVDWDAGIRAELDRLFGAEHSSQLLMRFHEVEPEIQTAHPGCTYREVLTLALERLSEEVGLAVPEEEAGALARSLPSWPVFPDVPPALVEARRQGWRLGILSNTDRDLIELSIAAIGTPFELAVVAGEIGSYKPALRHWEVFRERTDAWPPKHVHVAQSLFHDIAPATSLGIPCVWINRLDEPADARPVRTLPDLSGLPAVLNELTTAGAP